MQSDKNTIFFNQFIQKRRNRNNIKSIEWNGKLLNGPEEVRNALLTHFKGIFNKGEGTIFTMWSCLNSRLSEKDRKRLDKEISQEELKEALACFCNDKSPGPDEINMLYLKFFLH